MMTFHGVVHLSEDDDTTKLLFVSSIKLNRSGNDTYYNYVPIERHNSQLVWRLREEIHDKA